MASAGILAEASQRPGYLAGHGLVDADQVRELAADAALWVLDDAVLGGGAVNYQSYRCPGACPPLPRPDLPVSGLSPLSGRGVRACWCRCLWFDVSMHPKVVFR